MHGNEKWIIILSKSVEKSLLKIPEKYRNGIKESIDEMESGPYLGDVKKIKGESNLYRKKSGTYRILYSIYAEVIQINIVDIAHRKDIYK
jgi:mRNA interferase RelE/StbE